MACMPTRLVVLLMRNFRFDTLPSGVKSFYDEQFMAASSIIAEVQGEVNKANDAARPKPVALGLYASGALVVMVAGLAVGL
jgi:hypothetical protein